MHLGIDLGGTKIEILALDAQGNEVLRRRIDSPRGNYSATLEALTKLVEKTEQALGEQGTLGIGIPGALSLETGLIKNANSTWLIGQALHEDLSASLSRPVRLANDADCFALSEATDGAGKDYHSVFGVILGTGVGGGICIGQNLLSGPNAIAGEWGHNALPPDNRPVEGRMADPVTQCYCGKQNCIETYLSGPAFFKHFQALNAQTTKVYKDAKALAAGVAHEDAAVAAYFDSYLDRLARSLSQVINILDPDVIVFGGGMSNINQIYDRIAGGVAKYICSDSVRTSFAKAVHGDSSGVRGAAWLGKR